MDERSDKTMAGMKSRLNSTSPQTESGLNRYDLAGITHPNMTFNERFQAVSAFWREQNAKERLKRRKTSYPDVLPMVNGACNCDGAGWFILILPSGAQELRKCECGLAGPSPQEYALSRELEVLGNRTFDNFTVERPYQSLTDCSITLQKEMVKIAMLKAQSFAERPDGWLYIHGRPGTGKSHLAAAVANFNRTRMRIVYRSMPAMLDLMRENSFNLETIQREVASAELVIIDDLGADGKPTEWAQARIFSLINGRVDKPTVFTSNYDVSELPYGAHIIDRLNASRRCWINASSMRLEKTDA